jgi:pimeloyl-ACP methyl ester carboxylesterase
VHIERYGTGPRIFLGVHGWAGNHRTFHRFAKYLPEDCSFFTPDLPGYGGSPAPERWDASLVEDALAQSISDHGWTDVTLVGHCGGALFAAALAQRSGIPVSRLVMIDPFAYVPWYFGVFLKGDFGRYAYLSTFANPLGRWMTNLSLSSKRAKDTNLTEAFSGVDHEVAHHYLVMMASYGNAEAFKGIHCTVDVAYGERTFKAIREGVNIWRRVLPQTRTFVLKGAGHEPLKEATDQLAEVLFHPDRASARLAAPVAV